MKEMIRFVGLDVRKRVVEACILDAAGEVVARQRFELDGTSLRRFAWERLEPGDRVALEATTNTWAVAAVLRPHVAEVVVSNPLATKAIAQATVKTDKVDPFVLAQLLRCDYLPRVWQPDEATQQLRELTGRRSALVGQRTAVLNRIHSVLAMRRHTNVSSARCMRSGAESGVPPRHSRKCFVRRRGRSCWNGRLRHCNST